MTLDLPDLESTEALGRRLGELLFPGAVVALAGPLGAGKTHLVRAIAEGLEVDDVRLVNSPTFVLIQEYDARQTKSVTVKKPNPQAAPGKKSRSGWKRW